MESDENGWKEAGVWTVLPLPTWDNRWIFYGAICKILCECLLLFKRKLSDTKEWIVTVGLQSLNYESGIVKFELRLYKDIGQIVILNLACQIASVG